MQRVMLQFWRQAARQRATLHELCRLAKSRMSSRSVYPVAGLLLLAHAAIAVAVQITPHYVVELAPGAIAHEHNRAYSAELPLFGNTFYFVPFDSNDAPTQSRLRLQENGIELGPPHSLHQSVREQGGGRFSHWYNTVLFSTSDGSDPRVNGRIYTAAAPTVLRAAWRIGFGSLLAIVDLACLLVFWQELASFVWRTRWKIFALAVLSSIFIAALTDIGAFGTVYLAGPGGPADKDLVLSCLEHAVIGIGLAALMWSAGAGALLWFSPDKRKSLPNLLIPAYPLGILILAACIALSLLLPLGQLLALLLLMLCAWPLLGWRPPEGDVQLAFKILVVLLPVSIVFALWMGIVWHGPTATLSGDPSGDQTFYSSLIWSWAAHGSPPPDFGYELGGTHYLFNMLFSALGATLLWIPGFDPFQFIAAAGSATYLFFSVSMICLYLSDRGPAAFPRFSRVILVVAVVSAARYPFWIIESIPVIYVPGLAVSVLWLMERGRSASGFGIAAICAAFLGSVLSKVSAAIVLVPLASVWVFLKFGSLSKPIKIAAVSTAAAFFIYAVGMSVYFLPFFLHVSMLGPESLNHPGRWFELRDYGTVALAALALTIADLPAAFAILGGLCAFLAYAFLLQINYVCAVLLLGLMAYTHPDKRLWWRVLALAAFGSGLPAAILTDPAGVSSGVVWLGCLGGATLFAIAALDKLHGPTLRHAFYIGGASVLIVATALFGVANGRIILASGLWDGRPELTPEVRDIWLAVQKLTPANALIFTDQTGETPDLLGGWNTFSYTGQRQVYISDFYTSSELRPDPEKLKRVLADNRTVLSGQKSPLDVPKKKEYDRYFAVVENAAAYPSSWKKIYENAKFALLQILPQ